MGIALTRPSAPRLRDVEAAVPPELRAQLGGAVAGVNDALDELREIARHLPGDTGNYPEILATGGLRPALRALARRSSVPVSIDVNAGQRFSAAVSGLTARKAAEPA
jgi:signal transduction histidine kinase